MSKDKSVLDEMPVEDNAFPLKLKRLPPPDILPLPKQQQKIGVISACIHCGAPIYGPLKVEADQLLEGVVKFSCECRSVKRFEDTVQTK